MHSIIKCTWMKNNENPPQRRDWEREREQKRGEWRKKTDFRWLLLNLLKILIDSRLLFVPIDVKKMTSKTEFRVEINDEWKKHQEFFIFSLINIRWSLFSHAHTVSSWICYNLSLSMPQTCSHFSRCGYVPSSHAWNERIKNEPFAWKFSSLSFFDARMCVSVKEGEGGETEENVKKSIH